jgi:hypothetical protein
MHPSIPALLRYFEYGHLPPELQQVSKPFHDLAHNVVDEFGETIDVGSGAQLNRCLHKLLEAKDCAVRVAITYE